MEPQGWHAGILWGSGNQYLLQHSFLIEMDWPSLLGAQSRATSTDIQPAKESTDPLVQLHHEWPFGVIPSELSEGGTLSHCFITAAVLPI